MTSAVMMFRSGRTDREQPLDLLDTRYDMSGLDGDNSVAAGKEFAFGVGFERQRGAHGGDVDRVSVAYSTDDGATWKSAKVRADKGGWRVTVPGLPEGRVSLRVTGTGRDGPR
ncbi:hypothetical protein [Streptomyces sp. NPDC059957]|uniref:hypothetical protein n=1 Tax=Streptomyces sp. NPDC059957 TaxID=3347016 RepID=UPI00364A7CC8